MLYVISGTVSPLIGIGFQASAMFFTYQFCKRYFNQFKENKNDRLPLKFIAMSAAIASFPTALVAVIFTLYFRVLSNTQESESKFKKMVQTNCITGLLTRQSLLPNNMDLEEFTEVSCQHGEENALAKFSISWHTSQLSELRSERIKNFRKLL